MEEEEKTGIELVQTPAYYPDVGLEQADQSIKACLLDAGRNVIAVGYYLKVIRDRELFRDAGYRNIWEYAWGEYGFSKSTAHRYMARNDRFSVGGNSPVMAEEYREYSRAQLQEMLSLDAEQMEQVTPEMTVREIRELKRPKEIPYYEIPGQLSMGEVSLEDFLGAAEEPATVKDPEIPNCSECSSSESHTIRPEDFFQKENNQMAACREDSGSTKEPEDSYTCLYGLSIPCPAYPADCCQSGELCCEDCLEDPCEFRCPAAKRPYCLGEPGESVAMSQQELAAETQQKEAGCCENCSGGLSAYGTPARIYPADSLIATAGCEGGHDCFSCSAECGIRKKDRWCVEAPCGNPFPCEILPYLEKIREQVGDTCEFLNHDLAYHRAGDGEPDPCCKHCKEPCGYICGRAMKALDTGDKAAESLEEPSEESVTVEAREPDPEEPTASDRDLLWGMLEKEQSFLEEMLVIDQTDPLPDNMVRKKKLLVGALAGMLCDLEGVEEGDTEQPELPKLKNNDQRKEWLQNYQEWGIWYIDDHIGCRYYKYDFDKGARLIVEEYDERNEFTGDAYVSAYYHLVGGPEPPKHPMYGARKWAWHEKYNRYPDSMTELIEFLKAVQKGEE